MLEQKNPVFFNQIGGLTEVKQSLKECLILPSIRPDIFNGIRSPPKGILLYGPPGNGKTLLARALSSECRATFFNISASSLVSKFMGEAEKLMKTLFWYASLHQPAIIYIDEIDSILSTRGSNEHEASRRLKTEFLVHLDGVSSSDQDRVTVIGTTNIPESLDTAVLRRFVNSIKQTKRIFIGMPDSQTVADILTQNLKDISHKISESEIKSISKQLTGYTCSDIKVLIKEASMEPIRCIDPQQLIGIQKDEIRKVNKDDILNVMKKVQPSLTQKQINQFNDQHKLMQKQN